jgi:hypothetical protein
MVRAIFGGTFLKFHLILRRFCPPVQEKSVLPKSKKVVAKISLRQQERASDAPNRFVGGRFLK